MVLVVVDDLLADGRVEAKEHGPALSEGFVEHSEGGADEDKGGDIVGSCCSDGHNAPSVVEGECIGSVAAHWGP